jgi:hypothetical protein
MQPLFIVETHEPLMFAHETLKRFFKLRYLVTHLPSCLIGHSSWIIASSHKHCKHTDNFQSPITAWTEILLRAPYEKPPSWGSQPTHILLQ